MWQKKAVHLQWFLKDVTFTTLHQQIKENPVDLLIGNSYGARIAKEENIPLLRIGFPIYDRLGAQRMPIVGYKAGISLVDTVN